MRVLKAKVRLEGYVNQDWTLTFEDGTTHEYHACEESPRYTYGPHADDRVNLHEPELAEFLENIVEFGLSSIPNFDPDSDAVDFVIDYTTNTVTNIVLQIQADSDDYEYVYYPDMKC
jgi:hypothetical protein